MNKEITTYGVEKVTYTFDLSDIRKALVHHFEIPIEKSNAFEFYVFENPRDTDDNAELILRFNRQ